MKKIISLVLTLVLLVSVFAVLPVAANDDAAENGVYVYLDEGFHIVFVTDGEETSVAVAAKEMADYKTDGVQIYSIQDYANDVIDNGGIDAVTVNLLGAMLGYGRAAADYFNYVYCDPDEGNIVIDGTPVTDTADLLAAEAPEATYTDDAGIYIGATLILEGTMKLRFYFAGTDITATVDGAAATATAADGYSYVDVAVMPYDMAKAVTVQAGATTVTYAPINYLKNKATDATLSTMVASIYAYGVAAEAYANENDLQSEAIEIFSDRDSWGEYAKHGRIVSTSADGNSLSIRVTNNGSTNFAGAQLKRDAVGEMVALGFRYVSFTIAGERDSGKTPKYTDVYYWDRLEDVYYEDFFISTPDLDRIDKSCPSEHYYKNGDEVILDLALLYDCMNADYDSGLAFMLIEDGVWTYTTNGYLNFDNIRFAKNLQEFSTEADDKASRVLLVSIDGLRPDTLADTKYLDMLKAMGAYTLTAQTVNPSVTLPAHMSMFHSVTPTSHGVTSNTYNPSSSLGNGITETLSAAGLTSAMFYDWYELKDLTTAPAGVERSHVNPSLYSGGYQTTVSKLSSAAINHINLTPTDFTFLYYGNTDAVGEGSGFTSAKYKAAVEQILESLFNVLNALPDNYTVIITADHGGGGYKGDKAHGSTHPSDMTIPVFIIGDGFEPGTTLDADASILDIAPTVADLLGVEAEDYWVGGSLASGTEGARMDAALDLFFERDSWGEYSGHGRIVSTSASDGSLSVRVTHNSKSDFAGAQLQRAAVGEMISLGYRYLSFTVDSAKDSGKTPSYVDIYYWNATTENMYDDFFVTTADKTDAKEQYYKNGATVVIDLWKLYNRLDANSNSGLIFILIESGIWTPTSDGYLNLGNVELTRDI